MTRARSLVSLLRSNKGSRVEFKRQWSERALEDLAAFANHRGGALLLGVADEGTVVGFAPSEKDLQAIANQVSDTLGVRPDIRKVLHVGLPVLVITVTASPMPVPCRGRYLVRVGSVNREMSPVQIAGRFMEQLGETWDALPTELAASAVDRSAMLHFLELAAKRFPRAADTAPQLVLENLRLVRDRRLTRGGALLFGKDPQRASVSAQVHVGRFKGLSIEDDRLAGGTLLAQLEAVMTAFRTYLQKRVEVGSTAPTLEGLRHREVWEYPLDALREAVVNAIIHRDYAVSGMVEVRVHEESIEVWSPGRLPEGVTLEGLRRRHSSRLRNPLLAQAFFLAGLVERWGTGTLRMIRDCQDLGLPEPDFSEHSGGFAVTFRKDVLTPENLRVLGLNERQVAFLLHVKQTGESIENATYRAVTGAAKRTASKDLGDLATRGFLERIGASGRRTRYRARIGHESGKWGSARRGRRQET